MEIGGITSGYASQSYGAESLTEEQRSTLEEILAKYDSEDITEEELQALRSELEEAGIPRCPEAGRMIREAGLMGEPPEEGQGPPPGPPPQSTSADNSSLLELIEQYEAGEISQNDLFSSLEEFFQAGISATGNLLDQMA